MRDILFRGKTLNTGKWVEGMLVLKDEYAPNIHAIISQKSSFAYPVYEESIGQYTGVNDFNGAKIFEGDIVQYSLMTCPENKQFGCVKFYNGEFYMESVFGEETFMSSLSDDDYIYEIVGNIYDNPGTLKTKRI